MAEGGAARPPFVRRLGAALVVLSLGVSLALTLAPGRGGSSTDSFLCLSCSTVTSADAIRNVLLFAPLGAGAALLGQSPTRAVVTGLLLSAGLEAMQSVIPGRTASLRDLVTNGLGAGLGALGVGLVRRRRGSPPRVLDAAAVVSASAFAATLALTGWLFAPALPSDAPWYGGHMMNVSGLRHSQGTLEAASVGDRPIGRGRLPDGDAVRAAVAAHEPVRLRVRPGPRLGGLAPWLSLVDERQREILLVGPAGDALVWRVRTRGRALLFELPDVAADGLLAGRLGDAPLEVEVESQGDTLCLRAADRERCGLGTPSGRGWAQIFPTRGRSEGARAALDALWLAALAVPLGFFLRPSAAGLAAAAVAGVALALVPPRVGCLPATAADAFATATGVAFGVLAARAAARMRGA